MSDIKNEIPEGSGTEKYFSEVRNPHYLSGGEIECEVKVTGSDIWMPYTASPSDTVSHGAELFAGIAAGKWGEITPYIVTEGMIASARIQKMDEISAWRDAQESGNIYFAANGHRWDASKASQSRLAPVVAVANAGGLPPGFFWTDADNQDVPMDAAGLKALELSMQGAMVMRGFQIHERQRKMKEDIAQLTSLDAIRNYPVGWAESS